MAFEKKELTTNLTKNTNAFVRFVGFVVPKNHRRRDDGRAVDWFRMRGTVSQRKRRRRRMAYAAGRVINDADSHIMESLDWLSSHADPGVRDRLGSMRLEAGGSGAEKASAKALARQQDPVATAEIASNVVTGPKGWAA